MSSNEIQYAYFATKFQISRDISSLPKCLSIFVPTYLLLSPRQRICAKILATKEFLLILLPFERCSRLIQAVSKEKWLIDEFESTATLCGGPRLFQLWRKLKARRHRPKFTTLWIAQPRRLIRSLIPSSPPFEWTAKGRVKLLWFSMDSD